MRKRLKTIAKKNQMCDNLSMKRLGIFGGTFNPVHNEHIAAARAAVKELGLNKLIVMPAFMPPHKDLPAFGAGAKERMEMLKAAFSGDDKIEIGDFEIKQGGKSYTYLTAEHYAGEGKLFFIVGGDMLSDFKTWKFPEKILALADLAAFNREDFTADYAAEREYFLKTWGKSFIKLKYEGKEISSTEIRVYASLGLDITRMTAKSVADYIARKKIYSGGRCEEYIRTVLSEKRLVHTANVAVCALKKVKELGLSYEKTLTAALLHDCAKYKDKKDYKDFVLPEGAPEPVEHAFLGAYLAQKEAGINDGEVLDAIRWHTSGRPGMSTLSKLIFVADMVEKGRDYEGVERLRELYNGDFELCFKECLKEEVLHLINKKSPIYAETLKAYDYYIKGGK